MVVVLYPSIPLVNQKVKLAIARVLTTTTSGSILQIATTTTSDKEDIMDSPIRTWLKQNGIKQGQFALMTGVDRSDVCRVLSGQRQLPRKMKAFLNEHAPDVLKAHEAYLAVSISTLKQRLVAA